MKEPRDPKRTSSQYSCTSTFVSSEPGPFTTVVVAYALATTYYHQTTTTTPPPAPTRRTTTRRNFSLSLLRIYLVASEHTIRENRDVRGGEERSSVSVAWRGCWDRPSTQSPRNHFNPIDSHAIRSRDTRGRSLLAVIRGGVPNRRTTARNPSAYPFPPLSPLLKGHSRAKSETHPGAFASAASTHCVGLASGSSF